MAMTPEEMEAAIVDLQNRVSTLEGQMTTIAAYPVMSYEQGESIGGQGPFLAEQGATTQLFKSFAVVKKLQTGA
jgi:hypothetical protein